MITKASPAEDQIACEATEFAEELDSGQEMGLVTPKQTRSMVLYATDWTVETILGQLERSNIDLNPRFQRRDAWKCPRKSRFVESLILGLPIPQIVLAEKKGQRGKFIVLDGKQRLLTLLQFTGRANGNNNGFALSDLDVLKDLVGKRYDALKSGNEAGDLEFFHNSTIRSVIIRNWPSEAVLELVFNRLNTGSVSLSPQELRQALFPGPFTQYVDDYSQTSQMLQLLFGSKEPDFRMRDVELLVRYLAFSYFLSDYAGDLRQFLNNTCDRLNRSWPDQAEDIQERVHEFEESIRAAVDIFGKGNVGRKSTGDGRYEGRLNRAVIDVMAFYFSDPSIREAARANPGAVTRAFEILCKDETFLEAVEATTKSLKATHDRFSRWGLALKEALGVAVPVVTWNPSKSRIQTADQ